MTHEEEAIDPLLEAKDTLDAVTFSHGDTTGSYADYALAQATVALAEEQRTANLIALFSQDDVSDLPYGLLLNQIKERLGLA